MDDAPRAAPLPDWLRVLLPVGCIMPTTDAALCALAVATRSDVPATMWLFAFVPAAVCASVTAGALAWWSFRRGRASPFRVAVAIALVASPVVEWWVLARTRLLPWSAG